MQSQKGQKSTSISYFKNLHSELRCDIYEVNVVTSNCTARKLHHNLDLKVITPVLIRGLVDKMMRVKELRREEMKSER